MVQDVVLGEISVDEFAVREDLAGHEHEFDIEIREYGLRDVCILQTWGSPAMDIKNLLGNDT